MIPGLEKHKYLYDAVQQLQKAMEGSDKPNYNEAAIQLRSIATRLIHYYFVKYIPAFMGKRVDDEQTFSNQEKTPGKLLSSMRDYKIRGEREVQWLEHCITQGNFAAHPEKNIPVDDTTVDIVYKKLDAMLSGFLNDFPSDENYTDPLRGTVTITRRNQYFDRKQNRKYPALIAEYNFENSNFSDTNPPPNTSTYWYVDGSLVSRSFQLEIDDSVVNKEISCYVSSKENDGAIWAANQPFIIKTDNKRQGKVVVEVDPAFKGTQKTPAGVRLEAKLTHNGINILDDGVSVTWYAINMDGTFREIFRNSGSKGGNRFVCTKERSLGQAYHCVVSYDGKSWSGDSPKLTESDFEIKGTVVIRPKYSIEKGKSPLMMLKASVQDSNYQGQPIYAWERDGVILAENQDNAVEISKNDIGAVYICRIHHPGLVGERSSEPHRVENEDFDALEKKVSDLSDNGHGDPSVVSETFSDNERQERDSAVSEADEQSAASTAALSAETSDSVDVVPSSMNTPAAKANVTKTVESRIALPDGMIVQIVDQEKNTLPVTIEKELGVGGTCIVYRGKIESPTDKKQEQTVIVKEFYPALLDIERKNGVSLELNNPAQQSTLAAGADQFLNGLSEHSTFYESTGLALPRPFFFGKANGTVYTVSDFAKGMPLSRIDFSTLSLSRIASIMEGICKAIRPIHQKRKLYLDIKPDNFWYQMNGDDLQAKIGLFDFNSIVTQADIRNRTYKTVTASYGWVPPEQEIVTDSIMRTKEYRDPAHMGMHTDLYAMGLVLFWLLVGRSAKENDLEQIQKRLFDWRAESRFCSDAAEDTISFIQEKAAILLQPNAEIRQNSFTRTLPVTEVREWFEDLFTVTFGKTAQYEPIHTRLSTVHQETVNTNQGVRVVSSKLDTVIQKLNLISGSDVTDTSLEVKPSVSSKEIGYSNYEELLQCSGEQHVKYNDGSTYDGEWRYGVRHGFGRFVSADKKQTYVGLYEFDLRNGQGKYTDEDIGTYNGPWLKDKMHGHDGEMRYKDGRLYRGDFENGLRSGKGKCKGKSGNTYIGDFINDQACGYGTIKSSTGEILYEGYNIDGVPNGEGTYHYADGRVYSGKWLSGKPHGRGVMTYKSKDVYDGDWAQGVRCGRGKYTWADGEIYEGEWNDNVRNGHGTYFYKNGSVFEGDYKGGKKNGSGEIRYPNGDVRKGTWKEDKEEGDIIFTHSKSGIAFISTYIDGVLQKKGKIVYSEKEYYYGDLVDFRKDGIGEYHYANGNVFQGPWKNGKKYGKGKMILPDGSVFEGEWIDDVVQEIGTLTIPNKGTYTGACKDFIQNGKGTFLDLNGNTYVGCWRNGKRYDEEGIMYYANKDKYVGNWANDEINGKGKYTYSNGDVYYGNWKAGKRHGYGTMEYNNNFPRVYKGNWINGIRKDDMAEMKWKAGQTYRGEWDDLHDNVYANGLFMASKEEQIVEIRNCRGSLTVNGSKYDGEVFVLPGDECVPWGSGTLHKANGEIYEGTFEDALYHGEGKLTFEDGVVYSGKWEKGVPRGDGELTLKDQKLIGQFDGWEKGNGRILFEDGSVYTGEWKKLLRHGQGEMHYASTGLVYNGSWENGLPNGKGTERENGYVRTGTFVNGEKVGTFLVYHQSYAANKYTVEYKGGRSVPKPKDDVLKSSRDSITEEEIQQTLEDAKNQILEDSKKQTLEEVKRKGNTGEAKQYIPKDTESIISKSETKQTNQPAINSGFSGSYELKAMDDVWHYKYSICNYVYEHIKEDDYAISFRYSSIELKERGRDKLLDCSRKLSQELGLKLDSETKKSAFAFLFKTSVAVYHFKSIWRRKSQQDSFIDKNMLKLLAYLTTQIMEEFGRGVTVRKEEIASALDDAIGEAIVGKLNKTQLNDFTQILDATDWGISDNKARAFMDAICNWRPTVIICVYEYAMKRLQESDRRNSNASLSNSHITHRQKIEYVVKK